MMTNIYATRTIKHRATTPTNHHAFEERKYASSRTRCGVGERERSPQSADGGCVGSVGGDETEGLWEKG